MSDHDQPVAANILDRRFEADAPNQRWVGDTTEFVLSPSGTGKLYLAAIPDLFSRFIVGWAVSAVNDHHLTIAALEAALTRRRPDIGLLHHSDQGSTYASEDYQDVLEARGIVCSISRRGNCHDNAVMERCFSTIKAELADRFDSCSEAKRELFAYIEVRATANDPARRDRTYDARPGLRPERSPHSSRDRSTPESQWHGCPGACERQGQTVDSEGITDVSVS